MRSMRGNLVFFPVLALALAGVARASAPIGDGRAGIRCGEGGAGQPVTGRAPDSVKAFPTAEGFGAKSVGGRGG